jgi:hypothetical protein
MLNTKVGDNAVVKVENFPGRIFEREATVTAVDDTTITVTVNENASTLEFRKDTGVNVYGERYGWVELK